MYTTDTLQGEIILLTKTQNQSADTMQLYYGAGEYTGKWESENLAGTGISYENCQGIRISLSGTRQLKAVWGEVEELQVKEENAEDIIEYKTIEPIIPVDEEVMAEPIIALKEEVTAEAEYPQKEINGAVDEPIIIVDERDKKEEPANISMQERKEEQVNIPAQSNLSGQDDTKCKPERLSGDKWVQLNRIYPHIRPFGDKREYLSVGPRDFVVLTRKYQNLVQNSFLLHGYYNYGHVILTRIREGAEDMFYLGVPGVYYEREKQAALMFGFEGFESGNEVAGEGGFGYYMKRVDI